MVIGGFVYRGKQVPVLQGRYVFGDWGSFAAPSARLFYLDPNFAIKELRIGLADRPPGFLAREGSARTSTASCMSSDRPSSVPAAPPVRCSRSSPTCPPRTSSITWFRTCRAWPTTPTPTWSTRGASPSARPPRSGSRTTTPVSAPSTTATACRPARRCPSWRPHRHRLQLHDRLCRGPWSAGDIRLRHRGWHDRGLEQRKRCRDESGPFGSGGGV